MAIEYNFKYMPLVGKLSGESMVQQTETAINEIAQIVNENTAQAEIINTLAETANANSVEALEKANEALETSGRVYIKETLAVDLDNYCESQLIYIDNTASQNLPVANKGFLEVKTNDDKTQATQVFIADTNKQLFVRTGTITAQQVGDVTNYVASYGNWTGFLQLSGGTMTGNIIFDKAEGRITLATAQNEEGRLRLLGGSGITNGAQLLLSGKSHSSTAGQFQLGANDGTNNTSLLGYPNGTLTWGGSNVITAAGGTITGNVYIGGDISRTTNNSRLSLNGGNGLSNGAYLNLYGKDHANTGLFSLTAFDGTTQNQLIGKIDRTLTWVGQSIPERCYGVSLTSQAGQNTHTFNIVANSAIIFAKRGSACSCHMVTYWDSGSTKIFSTSTDPITITTSANSNSVTITDTYGTAVSIKILNGGTL